MFKLILFGSIWSQINMFIVSKVFKISSLHQNGIYFARAFKFNLNRPVFSLLLRANPVGFINSGSRDHTSRLNNVLHFLFDLIDILPVTLLETINHKIFRSSFLFVHGSYRLFYRLFG
ncbi:hypothetical protein ACHWQZ_G007140 [Mnemiopsis leidyi]